MQLVKHKYCLLLFIIALTVISSCKNKGEKPDNSDSAAIISENTYAKGFRIDNYKTFKVINVYNPWEHAKGIVYKYILTSHPESVPDSLKKYETIKLPIKKIVCLSTTHLAFLKALDCTDVICGVAAPEFIYDPEIRRRVEKGNISNVGFDQAVNIETIIGLKPDFVMAYGVGSEASGQFQRLKELGIKVVFNAEYLEPSPLGKAEWIKFVGAFLDKEDIAGVIFRETEKSYIALTKIAANDTLKPNVLTGLPWKGVWYVPGGKSYSASFIRDAGGNYLWKDEGGSESLALSLETVMERSNKAQIWINPGQALTLNDIIATDSRMKSVSSLKSKQVYNFNARMSPGGGNDFWESGVVHPDWILKDLIAVFHPELLPNYTFVYYNKLN